MSKLDPNLMATFEQFGAEGVEADREIDVIVGVRTPVDESVEKDLGARGFALRTCAGDVLTGSVKLSRLAELAESAFIVRIEASAPLYPEYGGGEAGEG